MLLNKQHNPTHMRLCNILELLPHISLVKGAKQANKQTKKLLKIQSKSACDLKNLREPP